MADSFGFYGKQSIASILGYSYFVNHYDSQRIKLWIYFRIIIQPWMIFRVATSFFLFNDHKSFSPRGVIDCGLLWSELQIGGATKRCKYKVEKGVKTYSNWSFRDHRNALVGHQATTTMMSMPPRRHHQVSNHKLQFNVINDLHDHTETTTTHLLNGRVQR